MTEKACLQTPQCIPIFLSKGRSAPWEQGTPLRKGTCCGPLGMLHNSKSVSHTVMPKCSLRKLCCAPSHRNSCSSAESSSRIFSMCSLSPDQTAPCCLCWIALNFPQFKACELVFSLLSFYQGAFLCCGLSLIRVMLSVVGACSKALVFDCFICSSPRCVLAGSALVWAQQPLYQLSAEIRALLLCLHFPMFACFPNCYQTSGCWF